MLSLDQLPLQAEGYRHLVSLITNYGMQYVKPTIGSGVMTGIGVALSQSCVSLHASYFSRFRQAMSDPGPLGGRPRLGRGRGDANTRVSFVLRPDATDEREVQHLLPRAIRRESAKQTWPLDAYTRDALIQVHRGRR